MGLVGIIRRSDMRLKHATQTARALQWEGCCMSVASCPQEQRGDASFQIPLQRLSSLPETTATSMLALPELVSLR